jgi:hypothetical protein
MQADTMARPSQFALLLLLGGCTLIDQRTFNPRAGMGPIVPPGPGPTPALISVDFSKPDPVYETPLRQAVEQALSRKPTVAFDVTIVVPATGTIAQQAAAAASIRADAREVARIITDEGVDEERVHMLARAESGIVGRQVQVYVH